jgi:hypothetical protein
MCVHFATSYFDAAAFRKLLHHLPDDGNSEESFGLCLAAAIFCSTFSSRSRPAWGMSGADGVGVESLTEMVQEASLEASLASDATVAAAAGATADPAPQDYLKYLVVQYDAACDGLSSSNGIRRAGINEGLGLPLLPAVANLQNLHVPGALAAAAHDGVFAAAAGCTAGVFVQHIMVYMAFLQSKWSDFLTTPRAFATSAGHCQANGIIRTPSPDLPYSHYSQAIAVAFLEECSPASADCVKQCMTKMVLGVQRPLISGR